MRKERWRDIAKLWRAISKFFARYLQTSAARFKLPSLTSLIEY